MSNSSSDLKKARKQIVERVQSRLSEIGFSIHDATTSWRVTNVKVDIFHFYMMSPGMCRKARVPIGSFWIEPKCFFPELPSLFDEWEKCDPSTPLPYPVPATRAQLKLQVFKQIRQPDCPANTYPANTYYSVPRLEKDIGLVIRDVLKMIDRKVIPFWSNTRTRYACFSRCGMTMMSWARRRRAFCRLVRKDPI